MDQAFFLRAKRLLERQRTAPTHQALLDHVEGQRAACATVRAAAEAASNDGFNEGADPLTTLLLGEADWRIAGRIQRGCFSRAATARRVNRP